MPLKGGRCAPRSPEQMLRLGLAYLPEDRDGQGLIMAERSPTTSRCRSSGGSPVSAS